LDICRISATELAQLIRRKQLSAREVVGAHLARIEAINPKVNAIVTLAADRAMEAARRADERLASGGTVGPLHGLPIAHKDLQATAGIRTTFGSPMFQDHVPTEDSPLVQRLKAAGAITIGKTNTPELGAGSQTFNPIFGATRNPYDPGKTCGGSSGGAAVALACRMLPIADGTDMGGSLRNPAAFCGVVGMRPSAALMGGDPSCGWSSLSVEGPMARTGDDLALLLDAMAAEPFQSRDDTTFRRRSIRVAWCMKLAGVPFEPRIIAVVDAQRRLFETIGCQVEEADPDFAGADEIFKTLRAKAFVEKHGSTVRRHRDLVKPTILWEIERGERLTAAAVAAAEQGRRNLRARIARFMERYDVIVLPTTQVAPFDLDEEYVRAIDGAAMETYIDWMKSCYYVSTIGHPAISVPAGLTRDGLPVGLQIVGRDRDDRSVVTLARRFEAERGPFPEPDLSRSV
jgi:amidase